MKDIEHSWFISDLHLGHQYINDKGVERGILSFERGNKFNTIQEHDNYIHDMLIHWGETHKGQTLYHLGDSGNVNRMRQIVDILRYEYDVDVIGVRGNHDAFDDVEFNKMFSEYYTMPQYIHPRIIVSHEPVWPCPAGVINLHGHLHAAKLDSPQHINCSIHVADYRPIGWKTIQKAFAKVEKPSYKFLREPYRDTYIFTQPKDDVIYDKHGKIKLKESIKLYNAKYGTKIQ
jgi:calcineurin-like phosphoesterase family protein